MKLIDIYTQINEGKGFDYNPEVLAELATTKYWDALKPVLQGMIADLLTQADDISKVHEGQMSLKAYGEISYIARVASAKIQSIIDLVEKTKDGYVDSGK